MRNKWFSWLRPLTVASILVGVIASALSFAYTKIGPNVALDATFFSVIVAILEGIREELGKTPSRLPDTSTFERPYLQKLADEVLKLTGITLTLMLNPVRDFKTDGEFFNFAVTMLNQLSNGDHVFVVCSDMAQHWRSTAITRWVAANYAAAKRGVTFKRILVARDQNVFPIAAEQAAKGIRVLILDSEKAETLPDLYRIPEDMGIAVVNGERVYMHWGSGQNFYGCFVDSRVLAGVILSVFSTLEANAEAVA